MQPGDLDPAVDGDRDFAVVDEIGGVAGISRPEVVAPAGTCNGCMALASAGDARSGVLAEG
jgi:hypothetical protein